VTGPRIMSGARFARVICGGRAIYAVIMHRNTLVSSINRSD
jgi:hypothetical protein